MNLKRTHSCLERNRLRNIIGRIITLRKQATYFLRNFALEIN